jgi:hypothetical protein
MRWINPIKDPLDTNREKDWLEASNRRHDSSQVTVLPLSSGNFAIFPVNHSALDNLTFALAEPHELPQAIQVVSATRLQQIAEFTPLRPSHPAKAPAKMDVDALANLLGDL